MKKAGNPANWTSWFGFGASLLAIALLTLWSIQVIMGLLDPAHCQGVQCEPTDLFFPLAALLVGWLVAVMALMGLIVKVKPWR